MYCCFPNAALEFAAPAETIEAFSSAEVEPALRRLTEASRAGYWIAGFFSYELGSVLCGLPARPAGRTPLVGLGVYERPAELVHPPSIGHARASALRPRIDERSYHEAFGAIRDALYEGDVYQVNLSVPFDFDYEGRPFDLFWRLYSAQRPPCAAYVEHLDTHLLSLSPELFVHVAGDRVTTGPMKGTSTPEARHELQSEKNRAEHVMIVDLLRNDLGKVCRDIEVERLFAEWTFPTYHALVSTIAGNRNAGVTFVDILRALFPCGSITGAPKLAAMRIIGKLEAEPRGIYTGSIGYLAPDGSGKWNVAIRTARLENGKGRLDLGGGIVADSTPEGEWDELLTKGRFLTAD